MRRPSHARVFSESDGDGRESLASEAFAGHAKLTATLGRVAMPYGCKLALASFVFVACVLSLSLVNFELGRTLCRATVGYGCLRG